MRTEPHASGYAPAGAEQRTTARGKQPPPTTTARTAVGTHEARRHRGTVSRPCRYRQTATRGAPSPLPRDTRRTSPCAAGIRTRQGPASRRRRTSAPRCKSTRQTRIERGTRGRSPADEDRSRRNDPRPSVGTRPRLVHARPVAQPATRACSTSRTATSRAPRCKPVRRSVSQRDPNESVRPSTAATATSHRRARIADLPRAPARKPDRKAATGDVAGRSDTDRSSRALPELVRRGRFVERRAQVLPTDIRPPAQQHASHAHEPALDAQVGGIRTLGGIDRVHRTRSTNRPALAVAGTQARQGGTHPGKSDIKGLAQQVRTIDAAAIHERVVALEHVARNEERQA